MIIVKLSGGLGNQMFEYSIGRALSIKNNTELKLDLSFLKNKNMGHNFVYRDYELDMFNGVEDFDFTLDNCFTAAEPHLHYSKEFVENIGRNADKKILIDGYWQSPLYFDEIQSIIRSDFQFKNKIDASSDERVLSMLNDIRDTNSVMINVRRTDYLNTDFHGVMGMEYINKAIALIESKIENPKYFIFSDDIEWCKENIKLDNMVIVDHSYKGDRFSYYLQLMIECKHFIIPNSTFAWWAAWLSESDNKIVIAPKNWFANPNINTESITPSTWIRI